MKTEQEQIAEKQVPVILEKSLNIYADRDPRRRGGDVVQIIIENQSIVPDQKAYSIAYDLVCECFDDICGRGTDGHTRYMSSAGVRIAYYKSGTTIKATVRDIQPNE